MATIIRHYETEKGFAVVVTDFETGFTARFQEYTKHYNERLVLENQQSFSNEADAISLFDDFVEYNMPHDAAMCDPESQR